MKRTLNDGRNLRQVEGENGRNCVFPEDTGQVLCFIGSITLSKEKRERKREGLQMKASKKIKIYKRKEKNK